MRRREGGKVGGAETLIEQVRGGLVTYNFDFFGLKKIAQVGII